MSSLTAMNVNWMISRIGYMAQGLVHLFDRDRFKRLFVPLHRNRNQLYAILMKEFGVFRRVIFSPEEEDCFETEIIEECEIPPVWV
jgi:hypothetical protein